MSQNDEKIKKLLNVIKHKKEKLGDRPRMTLKTNGIYKAKNGQVININTANSLELCVQYVAEIIDMRESTLRAARILDVDIDHLDMFESWDHMIDDFKLKVKIIMWQIDDKKIKTLESKLKELRSENLKTADELNDIEKMLN